MEEFFVFGNLLNETDFDFSFVPKPVRIVGPWWK